MHSSLSSLSILYIEFSDHPQLILDFRGDTVVAQATMNNIERLAQE
ncbi:hypothetical protein [Nitrospira sp. M1]